MCEWASMQTLALRILPRMGPPPPPRFEIPGSAPSLLCFVLFYYLFDLKTSQLEDGMFLLKISFPLSFCCCFFGGWGGGKELYIYLPFYFS